MRCRLVVIVAAITILPSGPLPAQSPGAAGAFPQCTVKPPANAGIAADSVDKAAKDSIRSLDLQTQFPQNGEEPDRRLRIPVPEELIWVALAVAVALILYALRDSLPVWRRETDDGWEAAANRAGAAARPGATDALAAADALSREGRFVDAMHMLLLQSLAEIRQQLGAQFADSLTSREILRGVRLPPQGRTSLRDIVAAVERTYFGGYPAGREEYAACRQNFDSLRLAMQGGATP